MNDNQSPDLTRTIFVVLFIGFLIAASFWILRPFLSPLIWAATVVVATWPLLLGVQARMGGRRWMAVVVMTVVLLLVLITPVTIAIISIVSKGSDLIVWATTPPTFTVPQPADWIGKLPLVGPKVAEEWKQLADAGPPALAGSLRPYAGQIGSWLVSKVGGLGMMIVQFLVTVIICAVLYAQGEQTAAGIRRFARRLAGVRGEDAVILAAKAIRGVALGVVVTALVQSVFGGIGLGITGVPHASLLTTVMLILCIAQLGPMLVMVPAIVWLFWKDHTVAASVLIAWTIVCGTMDNFLRPILIKKGADLPLLLIFAGVIGGLISFGIIGLFIGPVVLAVARTLLAAWINAESSPPPAAANADAEAAQ